VATMESASGKSFTTDLIMTATDSAYGLPKEPNTQPRRR
jgi:hypothetical protein